LIEFIRTLEGDVMILGAGGKIGPTLARTAKRAVAAAGVRKEITAVDRAPLRALEAEEIATLECDLLDLAAVAKLPKVRNVIYMAGRKFGSTGGEPLTWAANVIAPYHVARTFTGSRIVVFSTGCVYPLMAVGSGGATELTRPDPVGEYAMSCLGRERMFDYFSETQGAEVLQLRLNYAVEPRYGVLVDVAKRVWRREPVDVTTDCFNVIWQGDACNQALLSLSLASSPPSILNVTGPETISVRHTAQAFGEIFDKEPIISGHESNQGYLSNSTRANELFGNPTVPLGRVIQWTAHWIRSGGKDLGKPTHFEVQDGRY